MVHRRLAIASVSAILAMVLPAPAARGDSASDDRARIRRLDAALSDDAVVARRWYFGWAAGFAAAYAAQTLFAWRTHDEGLREEARVGSALSALGFVTTIALPPPGIFYGPSGTLEGDATTLRAERGRLEERLHTTAELEAFGRSWLPHVLGIAANAAAGAYLWFHFDRRFGGVTQLLVGSVVSELKIWSAPAVARDAERSIAVDVVPWASTTAGGAALEGSF